MHILALVAIGALALAACASEGDDTPVSEPTLTTAAIATTSISTTVAPSTTETAATSSTSTTGAATTTTTATTTTVPSIVYTPELPVNLYPPGPLVGSDGASGSGCSPGGGPLPSGVWFGLANGIGPDSVELDLACFYFGDIAYTEGAVDGEEVNNDYYIRNVNPTMRSVPLMDPTVWTLGDLSGGGEPFAISYADWPMPGNNYVDCPSDWCTVWLYVNNGVITDIVEQYLP